MTPDSDNRHELFPNRTLSIKRGGGWLSIFFGSPRRGDAELQATTGVPAMPLMKILLISVVIHVVVIGLTSIGYLIRCVDAGTMHPAPAASSDNQKTSPEAADKNVPKTQPAGATGAESRPGDSPIEKLINETSPERPADTDVNLDFQD